MLYNFQISYIKHYYSYNNDNVALQKGSGSRWG